MNTASRVAFLGLGAMGEPMARRLVDAGVGLTVWNRSVGKCRALAGSARVATTPADAAREADLVLLCLLNATAVENVVFGAHGVATGIRRGACLVDLSTIDPQWARAAHRRLGEAGAEWIDAPVSGGVPGASAGTLTMFCGGARNSIDAARPVLGVLASRITRFGETGAGLAAKLCNQAIVAAGLVAIAEAISLARRAGLDPGLLAEALQGGWADSTLLRIFGPRFAQGLEEPRLAQIATMQETLDMARRLASSLELPMPLADAASGVYDAAGRLGLAQSDLGALLVPYLGTAG